MGILDPVKPSILAVRIISNVDRGFAEKLGLGDNHRALGLITCDIDDALYVSLDEATKRLPKEDEFRRSFSLNTYNFDPAGNEYYTLVVNSPKLGVEETVRLILEAAKDL